MARGELHPNDLTVSSQLGHCRHGILPTSLAVVMASSLRFVGLKPRSRRSYNRAFRMFFEWMDDESLDLPSTASRLDELLASYLEHLWFVDFNVTYAGLWFQLPPANSLIIGRVFMSQGKLFPCLQMWPWLLPAWRCQHSNPLWQFSFF